jgi:hypothetical protein
LLAVRLARPDDDETIDAVLDPDSLRALTAEAVLTDSNGQGGAR